MTRSGEMALRGPQTSCSLGMALTSMGGGTEHQGIVECLTNKYYFKKRLEGWGYILPYTLLVYWYQMRKYVKMLENCNVPFPKQMMAFIFNK